MTTPEVIRDLIEKVEAGSGPDLETDRALEALIWDAPTPQWESNAGLPRFTSSIDAAVALTEKLGFKIEQINETYDLKVYWAKARKDRRLAVNGGNCASMCRAIVSATLRALLAKIEDDHA